MKKLKPKLPNVLQNDKTPFVVNTMGTKNHNKFSNCKDVDNNIDARPVGMKKILGVLPMKKYFEPPWLANKENFSF